MTFTSFSSDADGPAPSIQWDVDGDGFDDGSNRTVSRVFPTSGEHPVRLRATDDKGATHTEIRTVNVRNRPPQGEISCETIYQEAGRPLDCEVTNQLDDGTITSRSWDFDDDGEFDDDFGQSARFTFNSVGDKTIWLRLMDDEGEERIVSTAVSVFRAGPGDGFNINPPIAATGQNVTFTAPEGANRVFEWDLDGDGSFEIRGEDKRVVRRPYAKPGQIPVTLRYRTSGEVKPEVREHRRTLTVFIPLGVNQRAAIAGAARVGSALACSRGSWRGAPTAFSFEWLRAGAPIRGATDRRYVLGRADVGWSVTCRVTARNAGGRLSSTSRSVTPTGTPPRATTPLAKALAKCRSLRDAKEALCVKRAKAVAQCRKFGNPKERAACVKKATRS